MKFEILLLEYLNPCTIDRTMDYIDTILKSLHHEIIFKRINPGEMVGVVGAQSLGEPLLINDT